MSEVSTTFKSTTFFKLKQTREILKPYKTIYNLSFEAFRFESQVSQPDSISLFFSLEMLSCHSDAVQKYLIQLF